MNHHWEGTTFQVTRPPPPPPPPPRKPQENNNTRTKEHIGRKDKLYNSRKNKKPKKQERQEIESYEDILPSSKVTYDPTKPYQSEDNIAAQDFDGEIFDVGEMLSVNMMAHPLMSYFSKIRQAVDLALSRPSQYETKKYMQRQGLKALNGKSIVTVELDRKGNITLLKLVDSKGHTVIDRHWIDILNSAAPYPPIPSNWAENKIRFNYSYRYSFM